MPDRYSVHIDAALSAFALRYSQEGIWIADQAMPIKKVKKDSDKYFQFYLKDIISIPNRTQGIAGAPAANVSYSLTNTTYSCERYHLKDFVDDDTRKNADQPLEPDQDAARTVTELLLLDREKRVADIMFDTSTTFTSYTAALTGGDRWDDYENSDPFSKVEAAIDSVIQNSLKAPNTMIMGREVFRKIRHHPDILDRVKYTGGPKEPAKINAEHLAAAFDLEKVLVGKSVYNSANKGQTASPAYVWGKYVGIYYINPNPGKKDVTCAVTYRSEDFQTRKWREEEIRSDWVEVSFKDDEIVPCAGAGYVYSTVVS